MRQWLGLVAGIGIRLSPVFSVDGRKFGVAKWLAPTAVDRAGYCV